MNGQRERSRVWYGGIAGASFVVVSQLATRETLNFAQEISIICFAIGLPFAILFVVWPPNVPIAGMKRHFQETLKWIAVVISVSFFGGIVAVFYSMLPVGGVIIAIGGKCSKRKAMPSFKRPSTATSRASSPSPRTASTRLEAFARSP